MPQDQDADVMKREMEETIEKLREQLAEVHQTELLHEEVPAGELQKLFDR